MESWFIVRKGLIEIRLFIIFTLLQYNIKVARTNINDSNNFLYSIQHILLNLLRHLPLILGKMFGEKYSLRDIY